MRLACGWQWPELKLRKLNSEKMLVGSVNWRRPARHNTRHCGQVPSALCQVCSESGPVVTPACYWAAAAVFGHQCSCLATRPVLLCFGRALHKVMQFFFNVCFSMSSLGLIYSVITLHIGRVCNLSIHIVGDNRLWITQLLKYLWRNYRQEQMLFVFESLQELTLQVLISFSPKYTLYLICSFSRDNLQPSNVCAMFHDDFVTKKQFTWVHDSQNVLDIAFH